MKPNILICLALLLGGCAAPASYHPAQTYPDAGSSTSSSAQYSATVIECLYGRGCHPVSP
ncbi:MAG: hypothetical protein Q4A06_01805 [Cardiobacteriaceae bacterium]|nr:hypothetical protein [Cardiobacteriaceae bacterium]